jgi:hypothetical protein
MKGQARVRSKVTWRTFFLRSPNAVGTSIPPYTQWYRCSILVSIVNTLPAQVVLASLGAPLPTMPAIGGSQNLDRNIENLRLLAMPGSQITHIFQWMAEVHSMIGYSQNLSSRSHVCPIVAVRKYAPLVLRTNNQFRFSRTISLTSSSKQHHYQAALDSNKDLIAIYPKDRRTGTAPGHQRAGNYCSFDRA